MPTLLTLLLLAACGGDPSPTPANTPAPAPEVAATQAEPDAAEAAHMDLDDVETCASCHGQVVSEWRESMHSHAHHDRDPVYGAMRTFRMGKEGAELGGKCNQCHTPRAPEAEDSAAARNGVSCATCHTTVATKADAKGAKALVAGEPGTLYGIHDLAPGSSPMHATGGVSPVLADGQSICLACHAATKNPQGVAACTTGPEHAEAGGASCTSCHMPRVDGPSGTVSTRADHASHAFMGPHRAWLQDDPSFLAKAVEARAAFDGDRLTVTVKNVSEHGFPTGFPGRIAMLKLIGKDAAGAVVWSNLGDDPMTDDPKAVWNKVYVDADGKPTMPPYAAELKADRRLQADQIATIIHTPPAEVATVDVALVYRLLPPPAAAALGISDLPEAQPRSVVLTTVQR